MTRLRNFIARTLHRLAERITPDLSIAIDESVFRELAERDAIREALIAAQQDRGQAAAELIRLATQ